MLIDPTDLTANARQTAEERQAAQRVRAVERDRLRRLLSGELGRWFVMQQIERAGVFRATFDPASDRVSAFNEGARNNGLRLLNDVLEACPELWETMVRERAARLDSERGRGDPNGEVDA